MMPSHDTRLSVSLLLLLSVPLSACCSLGAGSYGALDAGEQSGPPAGFGPIGSARQVDVPSSGVELGLGWRTARSQVIAQRCIEFAPVKETGQVATLSMREVSDQSEIMKSLGVSAAVRVKTIGASGSARASFARNSKVRSNSTNLMLEATVENGVMFVGPPSPPSQVRRAFPDLGEPVPDPLDPSVGEDARGDAVRLKPWAIELLRNEGVGKFRAQCGDSFVSAINSGAQILATLQFQETDSEKRTQIKAALSAKYGPARVKAEAAMGNAETKVGTDLTITFLQVGGGKGSLPISQEGLVEKLTELPSEAFENPRFTSMEVTPYSTLADWPADVPAFSMGTKAVDAVVADYYWFLTTLEEDIEEILVHPNQYDFRSGRSEQGLRNLQDQLIGLRCSLLQAMATMGGGVVERDDWIRCDPSRDDHFEFFSDGENLGGIEPLDFGKLRERPRELSTALEAALTRAVPFGNPNVLRILLPLPNHRTDKYTSVTPSDVVNWYVRPQAMRMCALDPLDRKCLTNSELRRLEEYVPIGEGWLSEGFYTIQSGGKFLLPALKENDPVSLGDCEARWYFTYLGGDTYTLQSDGPEGRYLAWDAKLRDTPDDRARWVLEKEEGRDTYKISQAAGDDVLEIDDAGGPWYISWVEEAEIEVERFEESELPYTSWLRVAFPERTLQLRDDTYDLDRMAVLPEDITVFPKPPFSDEEQDLKLQLSKVEGVACYRVLLQAYLVDDRGKEPKISLEQDDWVAGTGGSFTYSLVEGEDKNYLVMAVGEQLSSELAGEPVLLGAYLHLGQSD